MKCGSALACRIAPALLITILFLAAVLLSCGRQDPDEYIKTLATDLKARTVPRQSRSVSESPVVRTEWSAAVTWEFETEGDWDDYTAWVRRHLQPDFENLDDRGPELVFGRHVNGDSQSLVIEKRRDSQNLRVRVTLTSQPD